MINNTYPVHERFYTWQGEGCHMGFPSFFVRLFGCPVQCPWCDSAGTWHPNWVPKDIPRMTPEEIVKEVDKEGAAIVVVTGGEPTVHNLAPLCEALYEHGVRAHLETSGAFPIRGNFDWVTLSPKRWKHPIKETIRQANEFKFIIEKPEDIMFYFDLICKNGFRPSEFQEGPSIWLHPEWSQRQNKAVLEAISSHVKEAGGIFRAGYQLHKLYQVDAADNRSRPLVPLGGDEAKGY